MGVAFTLDFGAWYMYSAVRDYWTQCRNYEYRGFQFHILTFALYK